MAFTPQPEFPDLTQLLVSLNNARISITNPALYQTIKGLIEKVQLLKTLAQEDIQEINQQITDLSNTVNNITIGDIINPQAPFMPTFDGDDGSDGFPIVGPKGDKGEDGKTIPPFDYCEHEEPPPLLAACCADESSMFDVTTTGNIDDLDFANCKMIRMSNASDATIRGLKEGLAGQKVTIVARGAGNVLLAHQDVGSAANNRLVNSATTAPTPLKGESRSAATYIYDNTTLRWRLIQHYMGGYISNPFSAGDFTASAGTWTVADADETCAYILRGRKMTIMVVINTSTTSAGMGTELRQTIPGGFTNARETINASLRVFAGAAWQIGYWYANAAATFIRYFYDPSGATNWPTATDDVYVQGVIEIEVS